MTCPWCSSNNIIATPTIISRVQCLDYGAMRIDLLDLIDIPDCEHEEPKEQPTPEEMIKGWWRGTV